MDFMRVAPRFLKLRLPKSVTQVCEKMWDIGGVVVKTSRGWRFLEVWNVTP
jgi:hypothetical protein